MTTEKKDDFDYSPLSDPELIELLNDLADLNVDDASEAALREASKRLSAQADVRAATIDEDYPDCTTDREKELYDALMGLASHAMAWHSDYREWTQGGVALQPIVSKALRLSDAKQLEGKR